MAERLRIRLGEAELEVEGDAAYIEERLQWFLAHIAEAGRSEGQSNGTTTLPREPVRASSPAEFIRQKRPNGGKETLLALAYYLEHAQGMASYTQQQVNDAAARAKLKSIHSQYFTTAVKEGLLRPAEKGAYALTLTGEDMISAMPRSAAE